jgi:hypothetical protein
MLATTTSAAARAPNGHCVEMGEHCTEAWLPHLELVEELRLRLIGFDQLKQLAELSCTSRRFE